MAEYVAPLRDFKFVIEELADLNGVRQLPGLEEATPDLVDAILDEGAKFVEEVLQPLNQVGDEHGCVRNDDGSVTAPPGFKEAYQQYCEAGWQGLSQPTDFGGQGLPHVISSAFEEYLISANMAFAMYPGLTLGAVAAIRAVGYRQLWQHLAGESSLDEAVAKAIAATRQLATRQLT